MRTKLRSMMVAALLAMALPASVRAGGDWNDAAIAWQPWEQGLTAAKAAKKPICLVFFTEWCPHCKNYSQVFHDAKVVAKAKKFVMVRLDKDKNGELSKKYAPDGEYIPRTYFLSSSGEIDTAIHAEREKFRYFYDEAKPEPLLAAMDAALAKLK